MIDFNWFESLDKIGVLTDTLVIKPGCIHVGINWRLFSSSLLVNSMVPWFMVTNYKAWRYITFNLAHTALCVQYALIDQNPFSIKLIIIRSNSYLRVASSWRGDPKSSGLIMVEVKWWHIMGGYNRQKISGQNMMNYSRKHCIF